MIYMVGLGVYKEYPITWRENSRTNDELPLGDGEEGGSTARLVLEKNWFTEKIFTNI
jgi:hypothetical protein